MSTYQDLLDAMRRLEARTGDAHAWQAGLTPSEVTAVVSPLTPTAQLEAILAKIRQRHPELADPDAPVSPQPPPQADGDAAKAIADAEAALAHQNSVTSQTDLQVISAVLNAHLKSLEGGAALRGLQAEIEAAVRSRSDLDTPAGARDFQRYLIGKLREIREVVATASLDDTSKAALMAAWTSLYNASKTMPDAPDERRPVPSPTPRGGQQPASSGNPGSDPLFDSSLLEDPGLLSGAMPAAAAPTTPTAPTAPSPSGSGGGAAPSGGGMPSLGTPSGLSLPNLAGLGAQPKSLGDDPFADDPREHKASKDVDDDAERDHHDEPEDDRDVEHRDPESPPTGPTTVTLPNGETVTAASPQLAAAIKAAAAGTPIADAYRQQGMTIPQPGTAVATPIDPSRVLPGDIGMFTDRHALALGRSRALLDGQIQHISTVTGPSFLGWEHPPTPTTQAPGTAPAQTDTPTPTRPSATVMG